MKALHMYHNNLLIRGLFPGKIHELSLKNNTTHLHGNLSPTEPNIIYRSKNYAANVLHQIKGNQ